ncbi:hypothetical protein AM587_10010498 [Phytophthora nicotianae]|uniref:Uncharacterized protein n=3 Tax=Phytophthora nicotianae TaxID=4792 RepID=A0A0W8CMT2_PHYNI|nr:hypothetical protein AM587_10010498 [Phytophthora nicotianae]
MDSCQSNYNVCRAGAVINTVNLDRFKLQQLQDKSPPLGTHSYAGYEARAEVFTITPTREDTKTDPLDTAILALHVAQKNFQRVLDQVKLARTGETHSNSVTALGVAHQEYIRALRRVKQIKYRSKKAVGFRALQQDICQLKELTAQLKRRHHEITTSLPPKQTVWTAVVEYFRVFRYGLQDSSPPVQQKIIRSTIASDVFYNGECGAEAILRSWKLLSSWFRNVQLELVRIKKMSANSVVAVTTTSITITEETLRHAFPHLIDTGTGSSSFALVHLLLDERLVLHGSTYFEWDPVYGRVTRVVSQADMITPVLMLLGSLEDVSRVFENALVSPTFELRLFS